MTVLRLPQPAKDWTRRMGKALGKAPTPPCFWTAQRIRPDRLAQKEEKKSIQTVRLTLWKNRVFHTGCEGRGNVENFGPVHSKLDKWRMDAHPRETKRNFWNRLSFGKEGKALFFLRKFPPLPKKHYGLYKRSRAGMLKTQWKKWKTSFEKGLLFHTDGGKPGGKGEKLPALC